MPDSDSAATPPPRSSAANRRPSGTSPSSTSTPSRPGGVDDNRAASRFQTLSRWPEADQSGSAYAGTMAWGGLGGESTVARDDTWSCAVVVFTFWFFVSVTMILGVYGSTDLLLSPHSSMVFQPSPLFVQYVKVETLEAIPGPLLYGTYRYPPLDVVTTWVETLNVSVPSDSHQEWTYYLNRGSEVNISYRLSSESSSVFLIIAEGSEGLTHWLSDPTYPDATLSWNAIRGKGMITQKIFKSSSYYVALGNLEEEMKVELNLTIRSSSHNTTNAYCKCAVTNSSPCRVSIFFPEGNAAVLVSPGPQQNASNYDWYVRLSYGPRWITYICGTVGLTLLMFWGFGLLNKLSCIHEDGAGARYEAPAPERAPLFSRKDDDLSSWGSSYDSLSQDEEDHELLTGGCAEGKSLDNGETSNNTCRLCAICFDAPRDCFFLPCGHCAACFECGTRIAEAAGTCPVCRRNIKKVRKIFTV